MAINLRFTDADWQRLERDWSAWWAGELERPLVVIASYDPMQNADWSHLTKFGLETPLDTIIDNAQNILEHTRFHGDHFPKWWVNYGAGAIAAFLGSKITWTPDTTWFSPLEGVASLADIKPAYNANNPWWQRVRDISRRAVERWAKQVVIATSDIGGNLDILASLRGSEKLLLDLYDAPEEVEWRVNQITRLWLRYYDELYAITSAAGRGNACWGPCWSPGKGYMLQCDFSYMISSDMFERFVLNDIVTCCDHLDYGFYHLDGKGQIPHLDHLLAVKRLRGIQWQPGDGQPMADGWLPLLKRIRDAGKLCQVYVTCAGALTIKKELGGKGFIMDIVGEHLTPAQADDFVNVMSRRE
jgi:5-methyltetrahydrofolate--homocysteine methyltransferase